MTAAATTHYACTAGHVGSYRWTDITTKTDASLPDAKHHADCHAGLATSTSPAVAAKIAAGMRGAGT